MACEWQLLGLLRRLYTACRLCGWGNAQVKQGRGRCDCLVLTVSSPAGPSAGLRPWRHWAACPCQPLAACAGPVMPTGCTRPGCTPRMPGTETTCPALPACSARGLVTWFPVHCTSMNNTNRLISGDNKGAAEQFAERWGRRQQGVAEDFVAAFAQSNVGDTSPNTAGPICLDTGEGAGPRGAWLQVPWHCGIELMRHAAVQQNSATSGGVCCPSSVGPYASCCIAQLGAGAAACCMSILSQPELAGCAAFPNSSPAIRRTSLFASSPPPCRPALRRGHQHLQRPQRDVPWPRAQLA